MRPLNPSALTKEHFVAERAGGAFVAAVCPTDCTYACSKLSQATELDEKDVKKHKKAIKICKGEI